MRALTGYAGLTRAPEICPGVTMQGGEQVVSAHALVSAIKTAPQSRDAAFIGPIDLAVNSRLL